MYGSDCATRSVLLPRSDGRSIRNVSGGWAGARGSGALAMSTRIAYF